MGYQLRMHHGIREWLTGLRDTEPELARRAGEALLALIDAGEALGPPLVVPLESVLLQAQDPREALDLSYQRQLEMMTQVRRGVADVATSRKRIELQLDALEQNAAKLAGQRENALAAGREDIAGAAASREAEIQEQLATLRRQHRVLAGEEERLTLASQRLQSKVEAFRVRKETLKASYTAAEASRTVRVAMADLRAEAGDPEDVPEESLSPEPGPVPGIEEELLREVRDMGAAGGGGAAAGEGSNAAGESGAGPGENGPGPGAVPPPGMMVLLPGAPEDSRAGLLFVVEPRDTAVLLACLTGPGRAPEDYQAAAGLAAERMPRAGSGEAAGRGEAARPASAGRAPDGPPADAFTLYGAESFLDEFFPGAETEVEIGAGALIARSRAHSLAGARQRMRLTQAQVAERMNVRQERVSAIERAEPGATEVRTLAAYVGALGGRLEIIAHVGDEHITLR
jgi:DNA-binding XRE family transcriptional regulator